MLFFCAAFGILEVLRMFPRQSRSRRIGIGAVFAALVAFAASSTIAQQDRRAELAKLFDKREIMIPVRDGVTLHTEIYTPKDAKGSLPFLFERTPYGISAPDKGMSGHLFRYSEMFADGYIFVFQDIRGRYGSEGKFEMLHTAPDAKGVTESTDTYDTIEWLIKNVPNNNG